MAGKHLPILGLFDKPVSNCPYHKGRAAHYRQQLAVLNNLQKLLHVYYIKLASEFLTNLLKMSTMRISVLFE